MNSRQCLTRSCGGSVRLAEPLEFHEPGDLSHKPYALKNASRRRVRRTRLRAVQSTRTRTVNAGVSGSDAFLARGDLGQRSPVLLRKYFYETGPELRPVFENLACTHASCVLRVPPDQFFQRDFVRLAECHSSRGSFASCSRSVVTGSRSTIAGLQRLANCRPRPARRRCRRTCPPRNCGRCARAPTTVPPVMYSQPWSPAPSTTAVAPEFRTAKRSPATPRKYASPAIAPYSTMLPMMMLSRGLAAEFGRGRTDDAPARQTLAAVVVRLADQVQRDALRRGMPRSSGRPCPPAGCGSCRPAGLHDRIACATSPDSIVPTVRLMLRIGMSIAHLLAALQRRHAPARSERWSSALSSPWSCVSLLKRATSATDSAADGRCG